MGFTHDFGKKLESFKFVLLGQKMSKKEYGLRFT